MTRPVPTAERSIEALLARARWENVPIRKAFVQSGARGRPQPGPLADLVRRHDDRALDIYLLLRAAASRDPWDVALHSRVWTRMLHMAPGPSATSAVSKTWRRLETARLVSRTRRARLTSVTVLREDGSGQPYTRPTKAGDPYLKLPVQFWLAPDGWYRKLSLPAKAVLLIALSLPDDFILPYEKAPDWYGISPDTIGRGVRQLRDHGLLRVRKQLKEAPLAPEGYTVEFSYTLQPPFGPLGYARGHGRRQGQRPIESRDLDRELERILRAETVEDVLSPSGLAHSAGASTGTAQELATSEVP